MICKWWHRRRARKKVEEHPIRYGSNHLAIIVGHTQVKPGAFSPYLNKYEYEYNSELAKVIKLEVMQRDATCGIYFRDDGGINGAYLRALSSGPAAVMELHFNAFNGRVGGCETLLNERDDESGVSERIFAQKIQNAMVGVLGNRDRGLKQRESGGERGFYNLSQTTKIPSIIIEPFFGDNSADAKNFDQKKALVCQAIAKTFVDYVNGS